MRVLHFFKTYWPDTFGGVERTIDAIATDTARHGIETNVLSLSKTPEENSVVFNGHHAYKAKQDFEFASTGFSRDAFSKFSALAAKADIIHYHFPWPFMDIVHFASRIQKPTLVTYHSDIVKQNGLLKLYRPLMRRFLRSVDRIVVTSLNYVDTSEQLRDFRDKTTVIPIGLARSSYPQVDETLKKQWRERLPDRFFLFIGVLRYYKGLHILLNAAKLSPYPIVIVGGGPTEQDLKTQAAQLGLTNIYFLGPVQDEDKVALLDLCSAVVFPSHLRSEAFGLSLVEASMFAKPMISCEIGTGTSFVNLDGVTGLIVPPDDAPALSQAMTHLWENPDLAAQYGQAALARYEQKFTAARMADAYASVYEDLLKTTRSAPLQP